MGGPVTGEAVQEALTLALVALQLCASACSGDCISHSCGNGITERCEECDDGNDVDWDGCNGCKISEFGVNTYVLRGQWVPAVDMAADGRFVVSWDGFAPGGDSLDVYGRFYDLDGAPLGSQSRVNTYVVETQEISSVSMFADGGAIIMWNSYLQDGDDFGIYGQLYNSDGSSRGTEFRINAVTEGSQRGPHAATASDGSFIIVWSGDGQDGDGGGVIGRRFNPDGSPSGSEFIVNTYTTGHQSAWGVAMDADGGFVVVWTSGDQDGDEAGIFGQRFSGAAEPLGGEFQINSSTAGMQRLPAVDMARDGRFVVIWSSEGQDGDGEGVFGQRFDEHGNAAGSEFRVNTTTDHDQQYPQVAMSSDGRFVVVWEQRDEENDEYGIRAQRYDSSGSRLGHEFNVNVFEDDYVGNPAIAMADDGRFVIVWEGTYWTEYEHWDVFAQRFDADGTPLGSLPW